MISGVTVGTRQQCLQGSTWGLARLGATNGASDVMRIVLRGSHIGLGLVMAGQCATWVEMRY